MRLARRSLERGSGPPSERFLCGGIVVQSLEIRRLDWAARKAVEAGLDLSPAAMLEAAELAHNRGDEFALAGIGRIDPFSTLVKP